MLILDRKLGEEIYIEVGDGTLIKVKIVLISDGVISIGVDAPQDVRIDRREVYEFRRRTNRRINQKED